MSDLQHKTHPEYMEKSNLPNALPKQILQNNIHYTLIGDCYFPTSTLPLPTNAPIPGKFAAIYESCLQENHPSEYTRLLWSNQLNDLLRSVQAQCSEQLETLITQMAATEGVTERLKSADQLEWLRRMNSIRSRAEEIILSEFVNK